MKKRNAAPKRPSPKVIVFGALIILAGLYHGYSSIKTSRKEAITVVARVNGQPLYESELNRGIVVNSFDSTVDEMKQNRLEQLISQKIITQFLDEKGVKVKKDLVDKEIAKLEKTPPSMGCACCTYPNLDAYLAASGMTREDLRTEIQNSMGLNDYATTTWKAYHPNSSDVINEIREESKFIQKFYVKGWQVFFNTFQQVGDQQQIDKTAAQNAQKAWERLQSGEAFETVAESMSEDMTSKNKGGYLDVIERTAYGQEVQQELTRLKPGTISKPVHSSFGYHIIKYEKLTDADVVKFCESYLIKQEIKKLTTEIMKNAKVDIEEEFRQ